MFFLRRYRPADCLLDSVDIVSNILPGLVTTSLGLNAVLEHEVGGEEAANAQ